VNHFAQSKPLSWFDTHLLQVVPTNYPGRGRRVYPGFLQHAGFLAMNLVRHVHSHWNFFHDLVRGEADQADAHRSFYDEYNAVLDMSGEYYLDCIRIVFQEHLLPRRRWQVAGQPVRPEAVTTPIFTVEGERDDISGLGQTRVAHDLCSGVPAARKYHLTVPEAGHYGIFSGRRWRESVYPRVCDFIAAAEKPAARKE
jgi:poly(3-hydroxybutyrate) depolymerase